LWRVVEWTDRIECERVVNEASKGKHKTTGEKRQLTGAVDEFSVAAELCRRGLLAGCEGYF